MDRKSKLRSREMGHDAPLESESEALSLSPSPPPRIAGNLSSMVVKPSLSSGGGSDLDIGYAADVRPRGSPPHHFRRGPQDPHRHDSPSSNRRRFGSSPLHRRVSPDSFSRRVSQPGIPRGGSPIGLHRRSSPPAFHPRSQRFQNGSGYMQRSGSISPLRRPRVDEGYYDPDFGHPRGSWSGRGMRGRGRGRFRDISPPAFGRGGRSYARGSTSSARAISPAEEEYIHRNDPNLSPREGDWICRNPSCGNLNFARRTYCNNCHKFRFDEPYGSTHSPRRGYASPPPPRDFSQRLPPASPVNRGTRRDFDGYRSPPRGWDMDDPRDFGAGLIPPRRGGKLIDPVRRENLEFRKDSFRGRGKSNWTVDDWEPRGRGRDSFISDSRGANRRSPSPQDRWIRDARGRSRSPVGGRLPRSSFVGRGRESRRYDGPYDGRAGDFDVPRGRGFRRGVPQVRDS
ncbi:hypothetical protein KSP39_PZI024336 [Platanthera zijinensis]|uniref:RanBP2-type domain-containing protein n=1 Tax=Platanthera zijinensis TaxID=2320716 RepID=A0AAP0ATZ5_9ASPA